MRSRLLISTLTVLTSLFFLSSTPLLAQTIDYSKWIKGFGDGTWSIVDSGTRVVQTINTSVPTGFISDFSFDGKFIEATISADGASDDDFIGFIFGYQSSAAFYTFDWKKATQDSGGVVAKVGMAINKITGTPLSFNEGWGHTGKYIELARNSTAWEYPKIHNFKLRFINNQITIWVDNKQVFDLNDTSYSGGKFGFYNLSQPTTSYTVLVLDQVPTAEIKAPSSAFAGKPVALSGSNSSDPDSTDTLTYKWDFGDGTTATEANVSHVYEAPGVFQVKLIVNDGKVDSLPATWTITIQQPSCAANITSSAPSNFGLSFMLSLVLSLAGGIYLGRRVRA